MRIAWLSPTAGNSGIVEYTRQVVPRLSRHVDVDVFSDGEPERPPDGATVVDYRAAPGRLAELAGYDLVVFNLGNHLGFHQRELEISRTTPGVVILHDRTLHHLWAGWYIGRVQRPDVYAARMSALYGVRGHEVARAFIAHRSEVAWAHPAEVLEHNFVPDTLAGALGVVVHCHAHAAQVRRDWSGPVCDLPFPAYGSQLARPVAPTADDGPLRLVSIGHVDGHKQLHAVIAALARDRTLAERVSYTILGGYDARSAYVRDLNRQIADAGLAHTVKLIGYQPAGVLQRYLDGADAFANLRMPNLESGSATLMEQMARGRPTLVHANGSFADLPRDAVVRVPVGDPWALALALRQLADSPGRRRRIGAAARAYAESVSVDAYVAELARFAGTAVRWPVRRALSVHAGAEMRWLGMDGRDGARSVADAIDALLS